MEQSKRIKLNFIAQLLLTGFFLLVFILATAGSFLWGGGILLSGDYTSQELLPAFTLGWVAILCAALLLPSIVIAFRQTFFHSTKPAWRLKNSFRTATILLLIWPVLLLIGYFLSKNSGATVLILAPVQVAATAIPLWWIVEFFKRNLSHESKEQNWDLINFQITTNPWMTITAEIVALIAFIALIGLWLSTQPGMIDKIDRLSQRLMYAAMQPSVIERILTPYLQMPGVIFIILAFSSGIVPIIEEMIKPVFVWSELNDETTPTDGFVFGLACGAMFALLESMGMLMSPGIQEAWLPLILGRVGTGILHTGTTALLGWGLASAWSESRYFRLGWCALGAIVLHGTWNLFGILGGLNVLFSSTQPGSNMQAFQFISKIAPYGLIVMVGIILTMLLSLKHNLQKSNLPLS